jgi:tetratricopeptide (TPR) repeat protein
MPIRSVTLPLLLMVASSAMIVDAHSAHDPIALSRAGTQAIEDQRFGDALDAFTRAAAMKPGDASLCFGAGVAAFMLGQDELAQTRFECALSRNPSYLPAAVWLGDLHYRAGRLRDAISIYEAARLRSPGDREMEKQLASWREELALQSRFHDVRSEHFIGLYESVTDEPIAREALSRLEAASLRIGNALGVFASQPITVVLYTREHYNRITNLASWSAAGYDGRIRVPLDGTPAQRDELDRVLSHELVHAIVMKLGGRTVPAWMSEGLATVLEPAGSADVEAAVTRGSRAPDLSALHRGFADLSRRDAEVAYASAARAVRRLLDQRGTGAVVALLEDLGRGAPFARAFHQRIAMRYEDFAALVARDH